MLMNKILRFSLVALMAMVMGNVYADDVTDVMTWESLGLDGSGSSYNEFSNIKLTSKAVYTAQASSGGGKYIQLRTNNNNSGIVATGSGGNLKSVTITFNEKTTDRAVEVYGKNEAYANAADLYGDAKGTLLGTIAANAESKTLTVEGEYTFVGLKSANAAIYVDKIEVTWTSGGGGGSTGEFWDASTLDLTTAITTRENKNENLKAVPEQYPGEAPDEAQIRADATAALVLTDYIFSVETASVKLTGVSTPNSDGAPEEAWRYPTTDTKQFLNLDACPVKFAGSYLQAKTGNPSMLDIEYFFTNSDDNRVGPRTVEDFWTPGCGKLPAKGEYIEVSFSKAGTFVAGLFIQRPTSNLYILDKETIQLLAPSAIKIAGFNNNNTVKPAEDADAYQPMKVNDDYTISYANPDYSINTGKQVFGHVSFDVEAGKTYLMFNPKNQLGIYGFQFTPNEDPSGVETIKTNKVWNADAPMYNLSGQKVDKSYKGVVIMNGKKMIQK